MAAQLVGQVVELGRAASHRERAVVDGDPERAGAGGVPASRRHRELEVPAAGAQRLGLSLGVVRGVQQGGEDRLAGRTPASRHLGIVADGVDARRRLSRMWIEAGTVPSVPSPLDLDRVLE
jgi:hypothetical protein